MGFKNEFKRYIPDRQKRCAAIIHSASAVAATAAGVTVVPGSDSIAIAPVQVAMITALADEFGIPDTGRTEPCARPFTPPWAPW